MPISAKRSFARGSLLWSGWYFLASLRKADLMSAALADFVTPRTSYGLRIMSPFSGARLNQKRGRRCLPSPIWAFAAPPCKSGAVAGARRPIRPELRRVERVVDPGRGGYDG